MISKGSICGTMDEESSMSCLLSCSKDSHFQVSSYFLVVCNILCALLLVFGESPEYCVALLYSLIFIWQYYVVKTSDRWKANWVMEIRPDKYSVIRITIDIHTFSIAKSLQKKQT